jgi:putative acetyltransferase
MRGAVQIQPERPDHPEVIVLLDALDRYLASLYAPEHNHILDVRALLAPGVDFLAARIDGRIVGCGATRRLASPSGAYGEVKRMVVDPTRRGHGVGRSLLAELERRLIADGVRVARLETGAEQHEAVRLYRRSGYVPCGPFNGYPDNGLSLFMEKTLA